MWFIYEAKIALPIRWSDIHGRLRYLISLRLSKHSHAVVLVTSCKKLKLVKMQEQKARAVGSGRELCVNRSMMMEMSACKEEFIYVVPKRLMHTKENAHSMGLEVVQTFTWEVLRLHDPDWSLLHSPLCNSSASKHRSKWWITIKWKPIEIITEYIPLYFSRIRVLRTGLHVLCLAPQWRPHL